MRHPFAAWRRRRGRVGPWSRSVTAEAVCAVLQPQHASGSSGDQDSRAWERGMAEASFGMLRSTLDPSGRDVEREETARPDPRPHSLSLSTGS